VTLFALAPREESGARGVLEDLADTLASPGRTFQIVLCADLLRDGHALQKKEMVNGAVQGWLVGGTADLLRSYGPLVCLPQFVNHFGVPSKILLASNKDDRQSTAEMHDLGDPLRRNKR
jgi:hypothetical protein